MDDNQMVEEMDKVISKLGDKLYDIFQQSNRKDYEYMELMNILMKKKNSSRDEKIKTFKTITTEELSLLND